MSQNFFQLKDGSFAKLYTLTGEGGMIAQISDFGGVIVSLLVPDKCGRLTDISLGFTEPEQYDGPGPYFGAMVGRYANRIGGSKFMFDGKEIKVAANEGENCLHGGLCYAYRLWKAEQTAANKLELTISSPDGDAGFPGRVDVKVIYEITPDNTLSIDMSAVTDAPTVVNLTNHCYFNLSGESSGPILDHDVAVYADSYQEVGAGLIPTGKLIDVAGTGFDLRNFTNFADALKKVPGGYDNSFVVPGTGLRAMASARSRSTGIRLDVFGTDCAVQFYSGSALGAQYPGKHGFNYPNFSGFCFETQHLVDSVNHPEWPSSRLAPGETYHQVILYKLSVEK